MNNLERPLVSIIIPLYNKEKFIHETLESVKSQSDTRWECILVDDGSTDKTLDIAKKYTLIDNRFSLYQRQNDLPKGPSSCRNYGVSLAKGDYVIFLDADDILTNTCVENRLQQFSNNINYDFLVFSMSTFESINSLKIDSNRIVCPTEKEKALKLFFLGKYPWCVSTPIYKKDFFLKIGGFNRELQRFTDLELGLKALFYKDSTYKVIDIVDFYYRIDKRTHIERKKNNEFIDSMVRSMFIYKKSIFSKMDKNHFFVFRNELKYELFFLINILISFNRKAYINSLIRIYKRDNIITYSDLLKLKIYLLCKFVKPYVLQKYISNLIKDSFCKNIYQLKKNIC
jgi:glycosyltransferase involved in cell wall biosynthesis